MASLSLIGFGVWMLVASSKFEAIFAEDNIMLVGGIMLGVGLFAFAVGFCGCCGALKESLCLLRMVSVTTQTAMTLVLNHTSFIISTVSWG